MIHNISDNEIALSYLKEVVDSYWKLIEYNRAYLLSSDIQEDIESSKVYFSTKLSEIDSLKQFSLLVFGWYLLSGFEIIEINHIDENISLSLRQAIKGGWKTSDVVIGKFYNELFENGLSSCEFWPFPEIDELVIGDSCTIQHSSSLVRLLVTLFGIYYYDNLFFDINNVPGLRQSFTDALKHSTGFELEFINNIQQNWEKLRK